MNSKKDQNFGAKLKVLRQKQGFSQEELAHLADLKLSNLAKLEGGFNSNPTLATLVSLAKILSDNSLDGLVTHGKKLDKKVDFGGLGERIKILRQEKGISQGELARLADLKLSNLAKLEGGFNSNPTLTTLKALARVLTKDSIDKLFAE
jgi:transcriptional regulator with XRE-family HTH domain